MVTLLSLVLQWTSQSDANLMTFNLSSMCGQSTEGLVIVMKDNVNINGIDYVIIQDTEFRR